MKTYNQIRYHSWHRGTKELDLILGRYADCMLDQLSEKDLNLYTQFLKEDDYDINAWVMGWHPPKDCYHQLVNSIQKNLLSIRTIDTKERF